MSRAAGDRPWRAVLAGAAPWLTFGVLLAVTADRWIVPFRDAGREVETAWRLASGEVLYRDVVSWFGPLPSLLDAAALKCYTHLDALVALRVLVALAGVLSLDRILRRATGEPVLAGALGALVVAGCFFIPCGGTVAFPYAAAALEGTVGCWAALALALGSSSAGRSAAAAFVAGLAAGTKVELLPAALLCVGPALLLRRPRAEAVLALLGALALGLAAWGAPVLLFGAETLRRHGYLMAGDISGSLHRFYADLLFGGYGGALLAPESILRLLLAALVAAAGVVLAARAGERRGAVLFALGLATLAFPGTTALAPIVPLALPLLALLALRRREPADAALLCLGLAMLVPLSRQPFAMRENPYTAFSAPLALAFALAAAWRLVGRPPAFAAFALGLAAAQTGARVRERIEEPRVLVRFPRGRFALPEAEARLVNELVARLGADTPPGSFVAGFPDAGVVLFLADRRSPFPPEQYQPGAQERAAEREVLELAGRRPLAAAFFLNRRHVEFGAGVFGLDYGTEVLAALRRRLPRVCVIGAPPPASRCVLASQALYFLPPVPVTRERSGGAPPGPSGNGRTPG